MNGILPGIGSLRPMLEGMQPALNAGEGATGFGDVLKSALQQVDKLHTGADQQIGALLDGRSSADVGSVMVSVEKADVAFQLMMQVRNKIVNAYQDIEKMQF